MTTTENTKPDWQTSLEHHETLCSERYEAIHKDFRTIKDDIRELRVGQRWIIGAVLVWPPIMITTLITLLTGG